MTTGLALEDVPVTLLELHCPMIWDRTAECDLEYMSRLIPGDEDTVMDEIRRFASRIASKNVTFDAEFLTRMRENRMVSRQAYYTFVILYAHLICFGAFGNGLVVLAVLRKAAMKTARNMFILNLAVSDLLLCLITMPLTLMEILSRYWPLGEDTDFLCKLFGGLEGVSVFVSSMSITAIALDRYQVIVYPTRKNLQLVEVCIILACIWALATLIASPMFIVRKLEHQTINQSVLDFPDSFGYCIEAWTVESGRAYYSVFSMVCQYVVPIITVSIAYARITRKLRFRLSALANRTSSLREGRQQRTRRTHTLLVAIALIYAVSWIPLNICNLVSDFISYSTSGALEQMRIAFAVCHMIGMSSACSNPILYGWLNDNFRKEFHEIAQRALPQHCQPTADQMLVTSDIPLQEL
ncbi:neuropeptide F receptor-like [Pollicipes pollicipes]|uniref:neuropeptide F receptor-like n=1 Tax=Pollicipes pollicipes TaxID=41117 RepID=UPI001884C1C8|nr:neuropeptide F receptor-like [Pollicipes pollicipes]